MTVESFKLNIQATKDFFDVKEVTLFKNWKTTVCYSTGEKCDLTKWNKLEIHFDSRHVKKDIRNYIAVKNE